MVTDTLLHSQPQQQQPYTIPNDNSTSALNSTANVSTNLEPEIPKNPKLEFLATCRIVTKVLASMQMIFFLLCLTVRFLNENIRYTYICSKSDIRLVEATGLISFILGLILFAAAHWERTICLVIWLIANGAGLVLLLFRMCLGIAIGGLSTFYVILIIFTLGMLTISLRIVFLYRKELINLENETNPKHVPFISYGRTNHV